MNECVKIANTHTPARNAMAGMHIPLIILAGEWWGNTDHRTDTVKQESHRGIKEPHP